MQAVLLVAGMGRRIGPRTEYGPKCMLSVAGRPLLHWSMDNLSAAGMDSVVMVVGHYGAAIQQYFGRKWKSLTVQYVENPEFARSGSFWSLMHARPFLQPGRFLLVEGDLLYHPEFVRIAIELEDCSILTSDVSGSGDEVFVSTNDRGLLVALGKGLKKQERLVSPGELSGISLLHTDMLPLTVGPDEMHLDYEDHLVKASRQHALAVKHCPGLPWIEIDTEADYRRATREVLPQLRSGGTMRDGVTADR